MSSNINQIQIDKFVSGWKLIVTEQTLEALSDWAKNGRYTTFLFGSRTIAIDRGWVRTLLCKDGKTRHYLTPAGKLAVVTWRMTGEILE